MDKHDADIQYYNNYKPIRNALRKYDPRSVLLGVWRFLHGPSKTKIERISRHPWIGLLLIKWTFVDEEAPHSGRPAIPEKEFHRLYQAAIDLVRYTQYPSSYPHISMFVRSMAYQQFLYSHDPNTLGLARQELMFAADQETTSKRRFQELTVLNKYYSLLTQ